MATNADTTETTGTAEGIELTEEQIERITSKLSSLHSILDNVLYANYSTEELAQELSEIEELIGLLERRPSI